MDRDVTRGILPPRQTATAKFPVVGEKAPDPEAPDPAGWRLAVSGLVGRPLTLSLDELRALPRGGLTADIHCVTGWSHFGMRFEGVPLAAVLDRVDPAPEARFVRFVAASSRGHDTSLPLELARADTWLVDAYDGRPLAPEHGGPLRTVTPSRYFYKSLKWVTEIELLAEDRLGYWERASAYHNTGDPFPGDQRFSTGGIAPAALERFRDATSFASLRGERKVIIGVDLRGWRPRTTDLGPLFLKLCDLRDADLGGADLRGANLSLCDFRGARLVEANLAGADLEGANFAGADLTDADLTGTALSATRFVETDDDGTTLGATITGMRWDGATGLLEAQEAYLRSPGGAVRE